MNGVNEYNERKFKEYKLTGDGLGLYDLACKLKKENFKGTPLVFKLAANALETLSELNPDDKDILQKLSECYQKLISEATMLFANNPSLFDNAEKRMKFGISPPTFYAEKKIITDGRIRILEENNQKKS